MKILVQETVPLIDPRKAVYAIDDLLGGPTRFFRPNRRSTRRTKHAPIEITETPLLDVTPERRGRGRPPTRPTGFPARLWKQWCRAVSHRGAENTTEGLARWLAQHAEYQVKLRARHGWHLEAIQSAPPAATVKWKTVVPRRDLTAAVEAEWRRRIHRRNPGEPLYRIHLLGIQIRTVVA